MAIQQQDITTGAISMTKVGNFTITTTVLYLQGNVSATAYSIGSSTALSTNAPLQIKESGSDSNGWAEEQDITLYNVAFTTTIPWLDVSPGVVTPTTGTASISNGDLIGIYGSGSWATGPTLNISRGLAPVMGTQVASLLSGNGFDVSEFLNGSAWILGPLNSGAQKNYFAGTGAQNAALVVGGETAGGQNNQTEVFNGAGWAASSNMIVSRTNLGAGGSFGSIVATVVLGGNNVISSSETYNGTAWSAGPSMSLVRQFCLGLGSINAGLVTGGSTAGTGAINVTELFNGTSWVVSGILASGRYAGASMGTQNAGMVNSGVTATLNISSTELFNGSVWSTSAAASTSGSSGGSGAQEASVIAGGGNLLSAKLTSCQFHNQNLYRKLTYNNFREAKNIGVATNVGSTTCTIKIYGYVSDVNMTSSNILITTAAQWAAGNYAVLSRYSPNAAGTSSPGSIIIKATLEADDYLVGQIISRTQMIVFNNNIYNIDNIGNW